MTQMGQPSDLLGALGLLPRHQQVHDRLQEADTALLRLDLDGQKTLRSPCPGSGLRGGV